MLEDQIRRLARTKAKPVKRVRMSNLADLSNPFEVIAPDGPLTPLVLSSPHSGSHYPIDLIEASSLSKTALRRSEDCYVDELFSSAKFAGVPMIRALYPRAYLDLNREPYELDPEMFTDPLPDFINSASPRVAAGLGTVARIVANQKEIYARKLTWTEVEARINRLYKPYHQTLRRLVNAARDQFGYCVLIDCHSMPSAGLPTGKGIAGDSVDVVLGDRNGLSCSSLITEETERILSSLGYSIIRNNPYAGGFTTQSYGEPETGVHALQIEINRALYVDEMSLSRRPSFAKLKDDLRVFLETLSEFSGDARKALTFQRLSAE
ncbi:MAG: N-formylglutamate amidohydrolase [Alphaproteobacteria bacterium]|nr:N-formylglutamate amidohydrolase [Alphaproteobacteria bacterium]